MGSPFLEIPESHHVASNALAFAVRDKYPVTEGHTLVIPRREVPTWFEATPEEQQALFELVAVVKAQSRADERAAEALPSRLRSSAQRGSRADHLG